MADSICAASLYVCRFRITRLNENGSPKVGANNMLVSDALARLAWEPNVETGTRHVQKNGCGDIVAQHKKKDQITDLTLGLDIVTADPYLQEMLVGGEVLENGDGYKYPPLGATNEDKVSVEAWSRAIVDGDYADTNPWIWWVLPETQWQYGNRELSEAFANFPFTGSATENSNWDNGPMNDWPTDSDAVVQHLRIDDLPDADCGYQTVPAS